MKKIFLLLLIALFALGCTLANPPNNQNNNNNNNTKTEEKGLPVELFVMSQCPYGTQAEELIIPAIKAFGDKVDFKIQFIASETSNGFSSLHGQVEIDEGIRQACIQKDYSREKFFDYLSCVNKDIKNVESNWKTCSEQTGFNTEEIESCSTGEKGKTLFKESINRTKELAIGSSPSYYINNEPYLGGRSAEDITRAICSYIDAEPCNSLPEETEVSLFVVNDLECNECNASAIVSQLKGFFPKLKVTEIDFTSEQGKKVLNQFQAETVPFFYFDETIKNHYNWSKFKLYTEEKEGLFALAYTGTKFFNRTEKPNHVDLFVMSQCPYGTLAENNLKEVAEAIPELTFNLYFIANEKDGKFESLHGQVEINEDIRQACIIKYNREKLLDYTSCVNKDIKNVEGNWKACAIKSEIEVDVIESCSTGEEGKTLFSNNIKEGNLLGIGSSPTFIINGQTLFRAGSAEAIKKVFCSYNDLAGCEKTLTGTSSNTSAPSAGCGA